MTGTANCAMGNQMLIVGLTGSIGMGKTTAAERFMQLGYSVFNADEAVHRLYSGEAAPLIEAAFPGTTTGNEVDRSRLHAALLADPSGFERLEAIVHPLVRKEEQRFLRAEADRGASLAVLEIPLLFETGASERVDVVIVVSAGEAIQTQRVLARPGMTEEKFKQILARQLPDAEKRSRADFVVDTSGPPSHCHAQIESIVPQLEKRKAAAYQHHWR